jgi:hypothetical protein
MKRMVEKNDNDAPSVSEFFKAIEDEEAKAAPKRAPRKVKKQRELTPLEAEQKRSAENVARTPATKDTDNAGPKADGSQSHTRCRCCGQAVYNQSA